MKTTREYIAEELRSIRAKRNETIEEISKKSGVNKDTISRYENNQTSMQIDILERLLRAYDVEFDIFFTNIYANKQSV